MFLRALLAFLILPGVVGFALPPLIAWADPWRGPTWWPGAAVLGAGAAVLLWCVRDFYVAGRGTLAPWSPPTRLVVVGLYRWSRNPMYVGVIAIVIGWSVLLGSPLIAAYVFVITFAFQVRVITHEEPWLARQFGTNWAEYSARVGRWVPRLGRRASDER